MSIDRKRNGRKNGGKKRLRRLATSLDSATGFSLARDFAVSLARVSPAAVCRSSLARLRRNLAHERSLAEGDFAVLLARWGLREEDVPGALAALGREARAYGLLALFSLAGFLGNLLHPPSGLLLAGLAGLACLSVFVCGLLRALACLWRARVLADRRFFPFTSWPGLAFRRRRRG